MNKFYDVKPGPLSVKGRFIVWWENLKWSIRAYFNE